MIFKPSETTEYIVDIGKVKINKTVKQLVLQGILAGMLISMGAIAYFKVIAHATDPGIGNFFASALFPTGIIGILLLGGELFTSDCMTIIGVYQKKFDLIKVLRMLLIVLLANWAGTIIITILADGAGIFDEKMLNSVVGVAEKKISIPPVNMLLSAILCNMIVCSGVMMAFSTQSTTGKIVAVWFAITVFALSGTEHIVANMFFISMGYLNSSNVTISGMLYNYGLVTLGNFIGGAMVISGLHAMIYTDKNRVQID